MSETYVYIITIIFIIRHEIIKHPEKSIKTITQSRDELMASPMPLIWSGSITFTYSIILFIFSCVLYRTRELLI